MAQESIENICADLILVDGKERRVEDWSHGELVTMVKCLYAELFIHQQKQLIIKKSTSSGMMRSREPLVDNEGQKIRLSITSA